MKVEGNVWLNMLNDVPLGKPLASDISIYNIHQSTFFLWTYILTIYILDLTCLRF